MDKQSSNKKTQSNPKFHSTSQKIFGANSLQIDEENASSLIGSIIEKGISDKPQARRLVPTLPPKPSVLPFPVARHRSHGPHWSPMGTQKGEDDDNDEDEDDEEENYSNFHPMAASFANPVQRKEKKGLDFSRWKELIPGNDSSMTSKTKRKNASHVGKAEKQRKDRELSNTDEKKKMPCDPSSIAHEGVLAPVTMDIVELHAAEAVATDLGHAVSADMEVDDLHQLHVQENGKNETTSNYEGEPESTSDDVTQMEFDDAKVKDAALQEALKKREEKTSTSTLVSSVRPNNSGNGPRPVSLESEIDAENRARLQTMTPDEIAEAQAEIMEKMSPALLNLLKRRGHDKLKKKKPSSSHITANDEPSVKLNENQLIQNAKVSLQTESDISSRVTKATSKDTQRVPDNGVVQNSGMASGSLWNTWSERVEAVRGLRFSLDGTVMINNFAEIAETGNSAQKGESIVNAAERDFLRTEGDPGAAGYTIKEAVALTRSVIPGQRTLALQSLASILDKALHSVQQNEVGSTLRNDNIDKRSVDWEAVWAFALGPEPELVLALRMCLDDNHDSVVLACAKVIQYILSCDINENFFDISEKIAFNGKDTYTAPVFRGKPEIDLGFLHGGFWKYSAKPSNILPNNEDIVDDETEGNHTIQDDIVVAGQDFAAGLVRMGILPRLRYLLETNPMAALEECIISILIAIARHSPASSNAIMKCQRLVPTVVQRFTTISDVEARPSKSKSVCLLRVLAQSDKKNCMEFIKNGNFKAMTWQLYQYAPSLHSWLKFGTEKCKLLSALMVQQLRFWKVCIQYGYCLSYFSSLFSALCLWLAPPTFEKLIEKNILGEFASISKEVYLVLEALSRTLPNFYSQKLQGDESPENPDCYEETWSWSYVGPMVDLAVKWFSRKSELFKWQKGIQSDISRDMSIAPLLWVYSAVMHFLSSLLERVIPEDGRVQLPWLPEFIPKIGLQIIKNGFLSCSGENGSKYRPDISGDSSFIEYLCCLRQKSGSETSVASVCCLHGLAQVVNSIDSLIRLARAGIHNPPSEGLNSSKEEEILEHGILKGSLAEFGDVLNIFTKLVASEWHIVQSTETFGRGGPAPAPGVGWGASGGGFFSLTVLMAQTDAWLLIHLLEIFQNVTTTESPPDEEATSTLQTINSALGVCLIAGPTDRVIIEKALDVMLQVPVLKYLDLCIRHFLKFNWGKEIFGQEYKDEDYLVVCKILASHFRNRWLCTKRKSKASDSYSSSGNKSKNNSIYLETIHEDLDLSNVTGQDHCGHSTMVEWAHQRLPLPMHWFLSPISTISDSKRTGHQSASNPPNLMQDTSDVLEVAKAGLLFLLGIEAMSTFLPMGIPSPVQKVSLVWKLHSMSVILLVGMGVLEEEKSRDTYESLQQLYGQFLDEAKSNSVEFVVDKSVNILPETEKKDSIEFLRFQSDVHESYSTFIETLVEQYAAESYGDLLYGRQVAVYLHRCTEGPVRLAVWNALSNARVLELLPPLHKCFTNADGYLEPVEDNEGILDVYVKSWVSGALDKAATRGSMAFTLALHHLSSFIFLSRASDKLPLRNRLAKSLLRDFSRKEQHKGMMLNLIQYQKPFKSTKLEQVESSSPMKNVMDERFEILKEACEGNSSLLTEVEKLKSLVMYH